MTGACEFFNIRVYECEPNSAAAPFALEAGETKKVTMFFQADYQTYKDRCFNQPMKIYNLPSFVKLEDGVLYFNPENIVKHLGKFTILVDYLYMTS
jgi:hypothetical protein